MDIIRTITTTALVSTLLGLSAFAGTADAAKCGKHSRAQRHNTCKPPMPKMPKVGDAGSRMLHPYLKG